MPSPALHRPRAGLLATQEIRGGDNREVLKRIKRTGDIFMAWSDREWVQDGVAVHVSMIGFDDGSETTRILNGAPAEQQMNADLTGDVDTASAQVLSENGTIAFMGDTKGGKFDIPWDKARQLLTQPNPTGNANSEVIRPWVNGSVISNQRRAMWIIDFGCDMPKEEAAGYEAPFRIIKEGVWPIRKDNRRVAYAERWWIHVEPRPSMRDGIEPLPKFIITTRVAKHRLFAWFSTVVWLNEEEERVLRLVAAWFEQNRTPLQSSEVQQEVR